MKSSFVTALVLLSASAVAAAQLVSEVTIGSLPLSDIVSTDDGTFIAGTSADNALLILKKVSTNETTGQTSYEILHTSAAESALSENSTHCLAISHSSTNPVVAHFVDTNYHLHTVKCGEGSEGCQAFEVFNTTLPFAPTSCKVGESGSYVAYSTGTDPTVDYFSLSGNHTQIGSEVAPGLSLEATPPTLLQSTDGSVCTPAVDLQYVMNNCTLVNPEALLEGSTPPETNVTDPVLESDASPSPVPNPNNLPGACPYHGGKCNHTVPENTTGVVDTPVLGENSTEVEVTPPELDTNATVPDNSTTVDEVVTDTNTTNTNETVVEDLPVEEVPIEEVPVEEAPAATPAPVLRRLRKW